MPTQRDLAQALGLNQATVSLALRGDRSISAPTRERVRREAERIGYRSNIYVSALMGHIRSGRNLEEKQTVGLVIDARDQADWLGGAEMAPAYPDYYRGLLARAEQIGLRIAPFFLQAPGMSAARIDGILHARGITGVVVAPPYRFTTFQAMHWERYACVGTGYGHQIQPFDRVAHDHHRNVRLALAEMERRGYRRIGCCLNRHLTQDLGSRWMSGYLDWQQTQPARARIPLFAGAVGEDPGPERFLRWLRRWRPEGLLTPVGDERQWLAGAGETGVGVACLVGAGRKGLAGIAEANEVLGATVLDILSGRMLRNEYGAPSHPRLILIEGSWKNGASLPSRSS